MLCSAVVHLLKCENEKHHYKYLFNFNFNKNENVENYMKIKATKIASNNYHNINILL